MWAARLMPSLQGRALGACQGGSRGQHLRLLQSHRSRGACGMLDAWRSGGGLRQDPQGCGAACAGKGRVLESVLERQGSCSGCCVASNAFADPQPASPGREGKELQALPLKATFAVRDFHGISFRAPCSCYNNVCDGNLELGLPRAFRQGRTHLTAQGLT